MDSDDADLMFLYEIEAKVTGSTVVDLVTAQVEQDIEIAKVQALIGLYFDSKADEYLLNKAGILLADMLPIFEAFPGAFAAFSCQIEMHAPPRWVLNEQSKYLDQKDADAMRIREFIKQSGQGRVVSQVILEGMQ